MNAAQKPHMTIRRMKTYTGGQGYVYQYYFVGKRPALSGQPEAPATEYVFDVTSDRKTTYAVSVFFPMEALDVWAKQHGRPLNDAEKRVNQSRPQRQRIETEQTERRISPSSRFPEND